MHIRITYTGGLEGNSAVTTRELLVEVAYALQHILATMEDAPSSLDPVMLEDLVERFSLGKIRENATSRHSSAPSFVTRYRTKQPSYKGRGHPPSRETLHHRHIRPHGG
jgi:hypothetical protein